MTEHELKNFVGLPIDTAVSVGSMVFGGVYERLPGLKVCYSHGGGAFPCLVGRWDHGYRDRLSKQSETTIKMPSDYLVDMYADSLTHDAVPAVPGRAARLRSGAARQRPSLRHGREGSVRQAQGSHRRPGRGRRPSPATRRPGCSTSRDGEARSRASMRRRRVDGADDWTQLGARRAGGHGGRRGRRASDLPHRRPCRSAPCRHRPVARFAWPGVRVVFRCGGAAVHPVPARVRTDRAARQPADRVGGLRRGSPRDGGAGVVDSGDVRVRGTGGHRDGADPHRIERAGALGKPSRADTASRSVSSTPRSRSHR